jgi:hypothetical protein
MLSVNLRIYLRKLFAPRLRVSSSDHTPILFEDYNDDSYYYILNNNKNNIYSLEETYTLFKCKEIVDPTTRLPVTSHRIVRVRVNR